MQYCSKKIIIIAIASFLLLQSVANARGILTCPSVAELKSGVYSPWLPLYIEGEELASLADTQQLTTEITHFSHAIWNIRYLESAHCFYGGGEITTKITLAQDAYRPGESGAWQWVTIGKRAECFASSPAQCTFLG